MKEINPNYWAPHNEEWAPHNHYLWAAPIPITNLPILTNGDILSTFIILGGFYDRLAGSLIYSILGESDYFDEDY